MNEKEKFQNQVSASSADKIVQGDFGRIARVAVPKVPRHGDKYGVLGIENASYPFSLCYDVSS